MQHLQISTSHSAADTYCNVMSNAGHYYYLAIIQSSGHIKHRLHGDARGKIKRSPKYHTSFWEGHECLHNIL